LEWHRDGYPHWHLFVLVDKAGHRGQIGFRKVLPYWEYGRVEEQNIHNQRHWDYLTGYFQKHGYFEKTKGHQARLPEWARERKKVIKRFTRKSITKNKIEKEDSVNAVAKKEFKEMVNFHSLCDFFEKKGLEKFKKTEGQMLDTCGSKTDVYIGSVGFKLFGRLNIPYHEFKKLGGEYIERVGHVIEMNLVEFELFRAKCKFCYN